MKSLRNKFKKVKDNFLSVIFQHKKQIEELKDGRNSLIKELMEKSIQLIEVRDENFKLKKLAELNDKTIEIYKEITTSLKKQLAEQEEDLGYSAVNKDLLN